jgi:hypothetical protein
MASDCNYENSKTSELEGVYLPIITGTLELHAAAARHCHLSLYGDELCNSFPMHMMCLTDALAVHGN